jgi:4-phytase/acid phosphatase
MRTLFVAVLLITATIVPAQTHPSQDQGHDELRFTLVFSRHGIRSPTTDASVLNLHSTDPWPEWEVPPGFLTPHGGMAIRQMGAYMRFDLVRKGLLPAAGCPDNNDVYLYADTDERTIMSARDTFAGMVPGCELPPVHTIVPVPGSRDPLFAPIPGTFPPPPAAAVAADRRAAWGKDQAALFSVASNPELKTLAGILAPDPEHPALRPILDDPSPLAAASPLIEAIFLEYVDGKPESQVGWGRIDASTLRRLIPLHVRQYALMTRAPLAARSKGSNLVAHILDTLEQAAQYSPARPAALVLGALGPVGARLVYINGHDDNLFYIGGLFNFHWNVDGIADDTPPDSQIVFELWQNPVSMQYSVRLFFRAQTINQLRSGEALTPANPPAEVGLTPPGCRAGQRCPFAVFDRAARAVLDPAYIEPNLMPTHIAPSNP